MALIISQHACNQHTHADFFQDIYIYVYIYHLRVCTLLFKKRASESSQSKLSSLGWLSPPILASTGKWLLVIGTVRWPAGPRDIYKRRWAEDSGTLVSHGLSLMQFLVDTVNMDLIILPVICSSFLLTYILPWFRSPQSLLIIWLWVQKDILAIFSGSFFLPTNYPSSLEQWQH